MTEWPKEPTELWFALLNEPLGSDEAAPIMRAYHNWVTENAAALIEDDNPADAARIRGLKLWA